MHKIYRSILPTEEHVNSFQRLCNKQIEEMRLHDKHMANVKKNPKIFQPYPPPMAHPDIVNSIVKDGDDYNLEFDVIDDPVEPLTPDQKRQVLSTEAVMEARRVQQAIIPFRKQPLISIRLNDLVNKEHRTVDEEVEMKQIRSKFKRINDIDRHLAVLQDQIEDLDDFNVDTWKSTPFPESQK